MINYLNKISKQRCFFMPKEECHKVGATCGKPQTKAPAVDKSAKKSVKPSKPIKKEK
jgi:DNA replication initiation complex subunit (GINS family)